MSKSMEKLQNLLSLLIQGFIFKLDFSKLSFFNHEKAIVHSV